MKRCAVILLVGALLASFITIPTEALDAELFLRVAMQDDIWTTNPLNAGSEWTWTVLGWIYDYPILEDFFTGDLIPYIVVGTAKMSSDLSVVNWSDCTIGEFGYNRNNSWADEDKPEATVFYDFTNVTWHDGVQMTIRDVLFSYHVQAQMPDWTSSVNPLKDKGGRMGSSYPNDHKLYINLSWQSDDGLQAALTYTLQEPFAEFFPSTLKILLLPYHIWGTEESGQVTETKIFCDVGYNKDATDAWSADRATVFGNPSPVGSGPFMWNFWDATGGISRIDTCRDHFYGPGYQYNESAKQPNIDAIVFKIFKTAEAAILALRNNDVDYIAWNVPGSFVNTLIDEADITLHRIPSYGFYYLGYNMRKPSFGYNSSASYPYALEDDIGKPLRRAIGHCLDKIQIVTRLLQNYGQPGNGVIHPYNVKWYNESIPYYASTWTMNHPSLPGSAQWSIVRENKSGPIHEYDPAKAIQILTEAGYQLTDPELPPGEGNWWLNPDWTPIGNGPGGKIEILTPQADYDPVRAYAGLMIAEELRKIGIYADRCYYDFGSIVDRIDNRQFDMYILGWRLSSDPTDYLHAFFHSSTAVAGQNYPGYQNSSFDTLIDNARQTGDGAEQRQFVMDAQAAIAYDLPYDVLYHRDSVMATSNRFVGWVDDGSGNLFNRQSVYNLRRPYENRLNARFVNLRSSMVSNSTTQVEVLATDKNRVPLQNVQVILSCIGGEFETTEGYTEANGKFTVNYTAPYVQHYDDHLENGIRVYFRIEVAYLEGYESAPPRWAYITVFPKDVYFLSLKASALVDLIDPDYDGNDLGFTYVIVEVTNYLGDPASNIQIDAEFDRGLLTIEPNRAFTDENGKATFSVKTPDLPDDDDLIKEFLLSFKASDVTDGNVKSSTQTISIFVKDRSEPAIAPEPNFDRVTIVLGASVIILLGGILVYYLRDHY